MNICFYNCTLQLIEEQKCVCEGALCFYVLKGAVLQAIPKDMVTAKIIKGQEEVPSLTEYLKINGENIKEVDFSLGGSEEVN